MSWGRVEAQTQLQRQQKEQETTGEVVTDWCSLRRDRDILRALHVPCARPDPLTPTADPQGPSTFLLPPPGTWLMLSKEPIFDCTLSLKSSFSDFTSTWPPPGREEREVGSGAGNSTQHCRAHWDAPVSASPHPLPPSTPPELPQPAGYLVCGGCCPGNHIWMSHGSGRLACKRFAPVHGREGKGMSWGPAGAAGEGEHNTQRHLSWIGGKGQLQPQED